MGSAWVRRVLVGAAAGLVGLGPAGCSDAAAPPPTPPAASPAPTFTVPPPVTVPIPTPTVIVTGGPRRWTMPDLVGRNLQEAQDAIQELTDFEIPITTSHDATGAGREQLFDRNWKVCSQNIPPGAEISRTTRIDFGTVRNEERCRTG